MSSFDEIMFQQRSLITSIMNTMANYKKSGQGKMTAAATRSRITSIKEKFVQSRSLHAKLQVTVDEKTRKSHPYFTSLEFEQCEDIYEQTLDCLHELIDDDTSMHDTSGNVSRTADFPSHAALNLPKIALPSFDGSYENWESFRDRFHSLIVCEPSLSNVQRLYHLCSCLKGEASAAIEHLSITSENFTVAWQILSSRYEHKRRLISSHLNKLFSLPSVTTKSAQELRALRDKVHSAVTALKNLERPVSQWSDLLVFLITQRLDKSSRESWEIKVGNTMEYPTYAELDTFLESRIRALDSILPLTIDKATAAKTNSKPRAITSHNATTTKVSCPVCAAQHLLFQCPEFANKTPGQRNELVRKFKRCVNCFRLNHQARDCLSIQTCKLCQKKHHTMLHGTGSDTAQQSDEAASSSKSKHEPSVSNVASHHSCKLTLPARQSLLATARIRVHSPHGQGQTVRALIDQGSGSSFITENLAKSLRLKTSRTAVTITGLGDQETSVRSTANLTFSPSASETPTCTTTALIMKTLTRYQPTRVNMCQKWPYLKGLTFADHDPTGSDPIDVIIGADLFGSIVQDGIRRGTANEPTAINTILGWIISGPTGEIHQSPTHLAVHHSSMSNPEENIRRFRNLMEASRPTERNVKTKMCTKPIQRTHYRNPAGISAVRRSRYRQGSPHGGRRRTNQCKYCTD